MICLVPPLHLGLGKVKFFFDKQIFFELKDSQDVELDVLHGVFAGVRIC